MFISDKGDLKSSLENLLDNKSRFYLSKIERINMLEKLVELFKKYALQNQNPEVIDLCEFIKYSINKYKSWTSNLKVERMPKGIVYHIPSSNILFMPFYSWVSSFLCGNFNFVRLSNSIEKKEIENLVTLLDQVLGEQYKYSQIFFEDKFENLNSKIISKYCDVRIIWGNNNTINEIKKNQITNASLDVAFKTRFSAALIDCNYYLKKSIDEKKRIAKLFLNDSLNLSFKACSSPHVIFFKGNEEEFMQTKKDFFKFLSLNNIVNNFESGIISTENLLNTQKSIINGDQVNIDQLIFGRIFIEKTLEQFSKIKLNNLDAANFIIRFESLNNFVNYWKKDIQTLSYLPNNDDKLIKKVIKDLAFISPDRLVPIGNALKFDVVWDGINFFETLTKQNISNV